jgi:hypothetical protein
MTDIKTTEKKTVVIRFTGDSGDGMQLTGTLFSNLSAILGNEISTFRIILLKLGHRKVLYSVCPVFRYI